MAVKVPPSAAPPLLTYEQYMAEGEINRRYEIIDGVRHFMANPTSLHQEIALNLAEMLRAYQRRSRQGRVVIAPCDVLITRAPLRVRQPDVLFISHARWGDRRMSDPGPLDPAPELVIEVLSPSETRSIREGKIRDYCGVDVRECWVVGTDTQTVEVLRLTADGPEHAALYTGAQTLQSLTFSDLALPLPDIFHIEE